MIYFNFNGNKYSIVFYPCQCFIAVTKYKDNRQFTREFKIDRSTKLKDFLEKLKTTDFTF